MVILVSAYYPISVLLGIFSDMIVVAVGGVAIYVAMTVRIEIHPTKGLLAGQAAASGFVAAGFELVGFEKRKQCF